MSYLHPPVKTPNVNASDPVNHVASIDLTVRFSASLPDLPLSLPATPQTTTATLKQHIRNAIPAEYSNRRIRLIHAGKALADDAQLTASLRLPSRAPSRAPTPVPPPTTYDASDAGEQTGKTAAHTGKGKTAIRDPPLPIPPQQRIYIHCSIGDVVLDPSELAAEAALASRHDAEPNAGHHDNTTAGATGTGGSAEDGTTTDTTTTTPAPRGFDRLLTAGFSSNEVQSLRLQFMAIQSHTHTPDTMPSPNTLRDMEDQWLDNDRVGGGGEGLSAPGADGRTTTTDEDAQAGHLDDMIWGMTMGFFWPLGCLMWGTREEGIWSQRRKMAVAVGVLLNLGIGFVRYTS